MGVGGALTALVVGAALVRRPPLGMGRGLGSGVLRPVVVGWSVEGGSGLRRLLAGHGRNLPDRGWRVVGVLGGRVAGLAGARGGELRRRSR